ncbi:hypothetical protein ACLKA6_016417 [Drosophila palustris]
MLLVFFDAFTKWVDLIPLRKATSAHLERAFREAILSRFGVPQRFVCDNVRLQQVGTSRRRVANLADLKAYHTEREIDAQPEAGFVPSSPETISGPSSN